MEVGGGFTAMWRVKEGARRSKNNDMNNESSLQHAWLWVMEKEGEEAS